MGIVEGEGGGVGMGGGGGEEGGDLTTLRYGFEFYSPLGVLFSQDLKIKVVINHTQSMTCDKFA